MASNLIFVDGNLSKIYWSRGEGAQSNLSQCEILLSFYSHYMLTQV